MISIGLFSRAVLPLRSHQLIYLLLLKHRYKALPCDLRLTRLRDPLPRGYFRERAFERCTEPVRSSETVAVGKATYLIMRRSSQNSNRPGR